MGTASRSVEILDRALEAAAAAEGSGQSAGGPDPPARAEKDPLRMETSQ